MASQDDVERDVTWSSVKDNLGRISSTELKALYARVDIKNTRVLSPADLFAAKAVANLTPCNEYPDDLKELMKAKNDIWLSTLTASLFKIGKDTWKNVFSYYSVEWKNEFDVLFKSTRSESGESGSVEHVMSPELLLRQTSVTWEKLRDHLVEKKITGIAEFVDAVLTLREKHNHIKLRMQHVPVASVSTESMKEKLRVSMQNAIRTIPGYLKTDKIVKHGNGNVTRITSEVKGLQTPDMNVMYEANVRQSGSEMSMTLKQVIMDSSNTVVDVQLWATETERTSQKSCIADLKQREYFSDTVMHAFTCITSPPAQ